MAAAVGKMLLGITFVLVKLWGSLKGIAWPFRFLATVFSQKQSEKDLSEIIKKDRFSQQLEEGYVKRLLRKFRQGYMKHGKFSLKTQIPHLARLAELYQRRYNKSGYWTDCLKAHSLYNSVCSREPNVDAWQRQVFEVQQDYWNENTVSYGQQRDLTRSLKEELKCVRKEINTELETAASFFKDFTCPNTPRDKLNIFSANLKKVSLSCSEKMANFAGKVIRESVAMLAPLKPPCDFVAIAIGSIARGEGTPYSDLEYLFLIDQRTGSSVDYFERLAMSTYFQIGNLGETRLEYMAIHELKGWFEDCSQNGFRIDGLNKHAGNIPTGNGLSNKVSRFIVTPEELAERYQTILEYPDEVDAIRGDLTAMLTFMKPIFSHRTTERDLLGELQDHIENMAHNEKRHSVNREMLINDISKFDFQPNISMMWSGFSANVKKEFYRFPSIILLDIIIITQAITKSSWESLNSLLEDEIISADFHHVLQFVLAAASYMRLSAYLYHNSQDDRVSIAAQRTFKKDINTSCKCEQSMRWFIPDRLFTAMCIKVSLLKNIFTRNTAVDLSTVKLHCDETWPHVTALFYSGRYSRTLATIKDMFGECIQDDPLSVITQKLPAGESLHSILFIVAHTLHISANYSASLKLFEYMTANGIFDGRNRILECLVGIGDYELALDMVRNNQELYEGMSYLLGLIYLGLNRYQESESAFLHALDDEYYSLVSLDKDYDYLGNPLTAEGQIDLQQRYDYYGDVVSHEQPPPEPIVYFKDMQVPEERLCEIVRTSYSIIEFVKSLGELYGKQKWYDLTVAYFKKCQLLTSDLYGDGAAVETAAILALRLGQTYNAMGQYAEADDYLKQSLSIYEEISYGVDRKDIATTLHEIATNLCAMGNENLAQTYYKKALATYRTISRNLVLNSISKTLHRLGVTYFKKACFSEAQDFLDQALAMRHEILHGVDDFQTASILQDLGKLCLEMKQYTKAVGFYKQAFYIYLEIYTGVYTEETAQTLNFIGVNYYRTGRYSEADDYYQQALVLLRSISHNHESGAVKSILSNIKENNKYLHKNMEQVGIV